MQATTTTTKALPEQISLVWNYRRQYWTVDRVNAIKIVGGNEADLPRRGEKKVVSNGNYQLSRGPFGRWIYREVEQN